MNPPDFLTAGWGCDVSAESGILSEEWVAGWMQVTIGGGVPMKRFITLASALSLLAGCQSPSQGTNDPDFASCPEPRPKVCTREYDPVCARRSDGSWTTLATGCTACGDEDVVGFRRGVCESSDESG